MTPPDPTAPLLQPGDMVPDLSLEQLAVDGHIPDDLDLLNHRGVAKRVTELVAQTTHPVNVAIFAPWGAGKSSLFGLMSENLRAQGINHVTFNAWTHAGDRFQANFLSEVSAQLKTLNPDARDKRKNDDPAKALYQSRRQLQVTWMENSPTWLRFAVPVVALLGLFFLPPLVWAWYRTGTLPNPGYLPLLMHSLREWVVIALGGSLIVALLGFIANASQVTVEQSQPSSVKQFHDLFDAILKDRAGSKKTVIFIDELDRCEPSDVVATLDGLRTFLHHDDCAFVVAFDRDSVATAIGARERERADVSDTPYYMTAGEYLDKVFQFQLALPPQTRHTLGAYAVALVAERSGIWEVLRHRSPDQFARVVRLLAPAHIGSPRRMKVLLNSFAVNMRLYEGFKFEVLERAEEIAVLTVLQTEFPRFAADVEQEPELLRAFATHSTPSRPRLQDAVKRWRWQTTESDGDAPEVDRLIGTGSDAGRELRERTQRALLGNLRAYLDRVEEMRVALPAPDLIHVHADGDLQKFEDSGIYSALRIARDYPRSTTLAELRGASSTDLIAAVRFLDREMENSAVAESDTLRLLIGDILNHADDNVVAHAAADAMNAWRGRRNASQPLPSSVPEPYQGFARAFLFAGTVGGFDAFLTAVVPTGSPGEDTLTFAIETADNDGWQRFGRTLIEKTLSLLPANPVPFQAALTRLDTEPVDEVLTSLPADLVASLLPELPEEPDASQFSSRSEQQAVQQRYETALELALEVLAAGKALLPVLLNDSLELTKGGVAQQLLLTAARCAVVKMPESLDAHDAILSAVDAPAADALILQAIADLPTQRARWLNRLAHTLQPVDLVATALDAVLSPRLTATFAERVESALMIASHASDADLHFAPARDALHLQALTYLRAGNVAQFEPVRGAFTLIDRLEPDGSVIQAIRGELYLAGAQAMKAPDPQLVVLMLQSLRKEDIGVLTDVATVLDEHIRSVSSPTVGTLLTLMCAQANLLRTHQPVVPLPVAILTPTLSSQPMLAQHWLRTGPRFRDVLRPGIFKLLPITADSAELWSEYTKPLTETGRTQIWNRLHHALAHHFVLQAVSGRSRDLATDTYTQLRQKVLQGGTAAEKAAAFRFYLDLPLETRRAAVSTLTLVRELAVEHRSGELDVAASAIWASTGQFRVDERTELRRQLGSWSPAAHAILTAKVRNGLITTGLLDPPKRRKRLR